MIYPHSTQDSFGCRYGLPIQKSQSFQVELKRMLTRLSNDVIISSYNVNEIHWFIIEIVHIDFTR